jgi:hypothetical protein
MYWRVVRSTEKKVPLARSDVRDMLVSAEDFVLGLDQAEFGHLVRMLEAERTVTGLRDFSRRSVE